MSEHGAFGNAGGAAGVLQKGDVIVLQRHRLERQEPPLIQYVVEAHRLRNLPMRHLLT
jgi:hypothetical protein